MGAYYLAVDIGASSGRHILGYLENGKIKLEEIYRFDNGMKKRNGNLVWDTEQLFGEILNGMKQCGKRNKIPVSMAVDTWAVDYALLDASDNLLGETFGYRDGRTSGMDQKVYERIPETDLYERTGIQKQIFNTIYQLMSVKERTPELLERAEVLLLLPDYFQFLLTGKKVSEYTNATTTQLVSPVNKQWDKELLKNLGFPEKIFLPLQMPGTEVGLLREEIRERVGFDCKVLLCASHDTASAVMAMPSEEEKSIYISSGTWSLMGTETEAAICGEISRKGNFTNEGGYDYRFRYLKNIMGLWMIQSVRHELGDAYSFAQLCEMAEGCRDFPSRVDVNYEGFLSPSSMIKEIQNDCARSGQPVPHSVGEIAAVIYGSLAESYNETVKELEQNTGKRIENIHIIGGGSKADYLNQLTADATGRIVYAGPPEATAVGNLLAQMIKNGELKDLSDARRCVRESFEIKKYGPR